MRGNVIKAAKDSADIAKLRKEQEILRAEILQGKDQAKNGNVNGLGLSKNALKIGRKKLRDLEMKEAGIEATRLQRHGGALIVGLTRERIAEAIGIRVSTLEEHGAVLGIRISPLLRSPQGPEKPKRSSSDGKIVDTPYTSPSYALQLSQQLTKLVNLAHKDGKPEGLHGEGTHAKARAPTLAAAPVPPVDDAAEPAANVTTFNVVFLDPKQPVGWDLLEDAQGRIVVTKVRNLILIRQGLLSRDFDFLFPSRALSSVWMTASDHCARPGSIDSRISGATRQIASWRCSAQCSA